MISKINFTGRESLLNQGIKATKPSSRYVNEATIFSKDEVKEGEERVKKAVFPQKNNGYNGFISQTEPVNRIKSSEEFKFVPETSPHGSIDIKA